MIALPRTMRRRVVARAGDRCEYCGLAQEGQDATFHVDHIVPQAVDGPTDDGNLALACVSCSLRKGDRRTGIDPRTREAVSLYHPRTDRWNDHFEWSGTTLVGRTPTGRATIEVLRMNRTKSLIIRAEEAERGRHPPRMDLD